MKLSPVSGTITSGARRFQSSLIVAAITTLILFTLWGCAPAGYSGGVRDSCTQGENMTSPRLVAGLEETEDGARIRITWDQGTGKGARLPSTYFQAVALSKPSEYVRSVALTAEREITVELEALVTLQETGEPLEVTLIFPDRRAHITCRHAGMDDRYYLKVSLLFGADGTLEEVNFDQGIDYGPI